MIVPQPPLLLITDRTLSPRPLTETVRAALDGGCRWVMVREKDLGTRELTALVREIVEIAAACEAGDGVARPQDRPPLPGPPPPGGRGLDLDVATANPLPPGGGGPGRGGLPVSTKSKIVVLVNGDIDAASQAGADGVHLPQGRFVAEARAALGPGRIVGVSCHSLEEARDAETAGADYVTLSPIFLTESKPGYGPALGVERLSEVGTSVAIPVIALAGISKLNARECLRHGAAGVAVMGGIMRASDPRRAAADLIAELT